MQVKTFKTLLFLASMCVLALASSCGNESPKTDSQPAETTAPAPNETQAAPVDSVSQSLDADAKDVNEARESLKKALDDL